MGKITRRVLLGGGAVALVGAGAAYYGIQNLRKRPTLAPFGFDLSEDERARGVVFLKTHPAIDAHAHPGQTFVRGASGLPTLLKLYSAKGTFEARTISDMVTGGLAASSFAAVSDFNVLDLSKESGLFARRPFKPGEAWESYKIQIANLKALVARGLVTEMNSPDDLAAAQASGKPGAFWTVEGGDFLEGSVERLREAHGDGVRSITLMHYRSNDISDPITGSPTHDGLTPVGGEIVREMNRLGMLIDLAHMSAGGARKALEITEKPVMFSHTHISTSKLTHPRFIPLDLARAATESGGVIGAWPAGIGISTLSEYADRIFELVDLVGIDHVCLGTDMDANYKPVFSDYRNLPDLVGILLKRGMSETEAAQFFGGNLMRVWAAAA